MDILIEELNLLWEPIRPYLARQVEELYGRRDGHVLEIGPFSGLIFSLAQKKVGQSFLIAAFPQAAVPLYRQEARKHGLEDRVRIIESDSSLIGIADESVDLAIFRGALFFPTLFRVDFGAIYRTLRTAGIAFVGGGFGKHTPSEVISQIGKRSEQLNTAMGRVRVTVESVQDQLRSSHLEGKCEITTEGGLWVVMKK
ncbi:MAG: class I SAM-dependent methyltransferase [Thermodesulfobacteriota bacterium]